MSLSSIASVTCGIISGTTGALVVQAVTDNATAAVNDRTRRVTGRRENLHLGKNVGDAGQIENQQDYKYDAYNRQQIAASWQFV